MINKYTFFGAAIILGFLGWSGLWVVLSSRIDAEISRNRAQLSAKGVTLTCSRESSGGFPFRLTHLCENAQMTLVDGTHVETPALEAFALIYTPSNIILAAQSPLKIDDRKGATVAAQFSTLRASVTWAIDAPPRISVEATGLVAEVTALLFQPLTVKAARAEFHVRQDPSDLNWTDVASNAANLTALTNGTALLAEPIDFETQAETLLAPNTGSLTHLKIHDTNLKSGALTLALTADLTANPAHQLDGQAKLEINDIAALPKLGAGTSWQGGLKTASTALIFVGEPISGTVAGRRVALTFENGKIKFRGSSLFTLPPLE